MTKLVKQLVPPLLLVPLFVTSFDVFTSLYWLAGGIAAFVSIVTLARMAWAHFRARHPDWHMALRPGLTVFLFGTAATTMYVSSAGPVREVDSLGRAKPKVKLEVSTSVIGPPSGAVCYRVLAIDGGGVRGIIPAVFLEEVQKRLELPIYRYFDVIAGTSTGALLALALTRPDPTDLDCPKTTPREMVAFYETRAAAVFPSRFGGIGAVLHWVRRKHDNSGINLVVDELFGTTTMRSALTALRIPAYEIEDRSHFFFDSIGSTCNFLMRDAARAATAAPSYLSAHRIAVDDEKGYVALIDGGVFANNPTIFALSLLPFTEKRKVLIVSLGTGIRDKPIKFEDASGWGKLRWISPLIDIMFSDPGTDEEIRRIMEGQGHQYSRLQPKLTKEIGELDDTSKDNIDKLKKIARDYVNKHPGEFDRLVRELAREKECPTDAVSADGRIKLRDATRIDWTARGRASPGQCRDVRGFVKELGH